MTDPQRAEDNENLVNPETGMPETREERNQREERQRNADANKNR